MTEVRFVAPDGTIRSVMAAPGARLLDVAQGDGRPLEGTCGGQLACATCHVVIAAADFARAGTARPAEEDMLDLVPRAVRTSRLACQVAVPAAGPAFTVHVPAG